jgi:hypothetical protein
MCCLVDSVRDFRLENTSVQLSYPCLHCDHDVGVVSGHVVVLGEVSHHLEKARLLRAAIHCEHAAAVGWNARVKWSRVPHIVWVTSLDGVPGNQLPRSLAPHLLLYEHSGPNESFVAESCALHSATQDWPLVD